jgi:hypothetical protein
VAVMYRLVDATFRGIVFPSLACVEAFSVSVSFSFFFLLFVSLLHHKCDWRNGIMCIGCLTDLTDCILKSLQLVE